MGAAGFGAWDAARAMPHPGARTPQHALSSEVRGRGPPARQGRNADVVRGSGRRDPSRCLGPHLRGGAWRHMSVQSAMPCVRTHVTKARASEVPSVPVVANFPDDRRGQAAAQSRLVDANTEHAHEAARLAGECNLEDVLQTPSGKRERASATPFHRTKHTGLLRNPQTEPN